MITNFDPYDQASILTDMMYQNAYKKEGQRGQFARFQRDPRPMSEQGLLDIDRARGSGIPTMYGKIMQRRHGTPPGVAGALGKSVQAGTSPALRQFEDAAIDDFYYGPTQSPFDLLKRGGY